MSDEKDDTVGYKKPPKHSRWKKGQCGYPPGRRKKKPELPNLEKAMALTLMDTVTVIENGKTRQITKLDAMMKQLINKAASGHMPSIKIAVGLLGRGPKLEGAGAEGEDYARALSSARERVTKRLEQMAKRQEDDEGVVKPAGTPDKKGNGGR
jgi:hypothetical protein